MSRYKNEQRRVAHRGRRFHFISYEAQGADLKRQQVAMPAMWYLESSGRRWPAIPQTMEQPEAELEAQLIVWLEGYAFAPSPRRRRRRRIPRRSASCGRNGLAGRLTSWRT
jgi:hypothetical protein